MKRLGPPIWFEKRGRSRAEEGCGIPSLTVNVLYLISLKGKQWYMV
ncbi:MAG: hypothetical protein QME83_03755 [Thermodesulfobacteriota bacterium]|nr:hypothetical protein [Thermodesulfobacteriota bacterium]